jgi:hypothetical protein
MPARLPILAKSCFLIDPRPLHEPTSAHAGCLAISRVFRGLRVPDLIAANLEFKIRQRGFEEGQLAESIIMLQAVGGECPDDIHLIHQDPLFASALGYVPPKATAIRSFLQKFHDEKLDALRPSREEQKSFIFPSSQPIEGLQNVQAGLVGRIAQKYAEQGQPLKMATVDQDATIIESHKKAAYYHYEGGRGYQPMVAIWAEADLVLADQWRDGNVPARQDPLSCAQLAFAALPSTVTRRFFRGDSACHENDLIHWLRSPEREKEPGGAIGFCVSASMTAELGKAVQNVPENQWKNFGQDPDGTLRQWAEICFVPGEKGEKKDSKPLRYVGLRLLKVQGALFRDGSDRHHHAVVTNLEWDGGRLLQWHREKAGTVEHVHDEVKNGLAGAHVPSQLMGVNAAWFKFNLITYNLISAIKGLCLGPEERTARMKKFRLLVIHLAGRLNRNGCVLRLRFCATPESIARVEKIWEVFDLPTQASCMKPILSG